jgi:lipopolysaccharide transport system ATP-binding protein
MAAIQNLCHRGIIVQGGVLAFDGTAAAAVSEYLQDVTRPTESPFRNNPHRRGDGTFRFTAARVLNQAGKESGHLVAGEPAVFELDYQNSEGARRASIALTLFNQLGTAVANFNMDLTGFLPDTLASRGKFFCRIPVLPLPLGEYRGAVAVSVGGRMTDLVPNALLFRVESSTFFATGRTPDAQYSACLVDHTWDHQQGQDEQPSDRG